MNFCTSVHCMDGRIQEPLLRYLKEKYHVKYVDSVTEPGPCKIISEKKDKMIIDSITERINISIKHHKSCLIAISGHYDCAANPLDEKGQKEQIKMSIQYLKNIYRDFAIIGLWIDENWKVNIV